MAFLLILLCVASVGGAAGILWMLFGPAGPLFAGIVDAKPMIAAPPIVEAKSVMMPPLPAVAAAVSLPSIPRLGVAAPTMGSHLAPRPRTLPPLPQRTARGTTTPPTTANVKPSIFPTDQVTIARVDDDHTFVGDADYTVVD